MTTAALAASDKTGPDAVQRDEAQTITAQIKEETMNETTPPIIPQGTDDAKADGIILRRPSWSTGIEGGTVPDERLREGEVDALELTAAHDFPHQGKALAVSLNQTTRISVLRDHVTISTEPVRLSFSLADSDFTGLVDVVGTKYLRRLAAEVLATVGILERAQAEDPHSRPQFDDPIVVERDDLDEQVDAWLAKETILAEPNDAQRAYVRSRIQAGRTGGPTSDECRTLLRLEGDSSYRINPVEAAAAVVGDGATLAGEPATTFAGIPLAETVEGSR